MHGDAGYCSRRCLRVLRSGRGGDSRGSVARGPRGSGRGTYQCSGISRAGQGADFQEEFSGFSRRCGPSNFPQSDGRSHDRLYGHPDGVLWRLGARNFADGTRNAIERQPSGMAPDDGVAQCVSREGLSRDFLKGVSGAIVAAGAISPWLAWAADDSVAVPGKDGMILRSYRFFDLEMPPEYANSWITPVQHFFVRNHMHEPSTLDAGDWRLSIGGEVENPLTLSLADLRKIESHTVTNTLECAGNGRGLYQ